MALDNEFRKRESKFCTERQPSYKNWLRKGSFFLWFSMVVFSIAVMIGLYSRVVYFLWTRSNNVELTHRQKVGFCQGLSSSDEIQWSLCNILSDYTSVLIARVILLSLETDSGVLRTICQIHIPNNAPCFPQIFCQSLFSIFFLRFGRQSQEKLKTMSCKSLWGKTNCFVEMIFSFVYLLTIWFCLFDTVPRFD